MLAKLVELLLDPLTLLSLLAVILTAGGLLLAGFTSAGGAGQRRGGGYAWLLLVLMLCLTWVASAPAVVNPLLATLENSVPEDQSCLSATIPLAVLSGGVSSRVRSASQLGAMYRPTFARVSAAAEVSMATSHATSVIALGGSVRRGIAEADVMAYFFERMGVPAEKIIRERVSSNTAQSAVELGRMLTEQGLPQNIRLLTSALHMARAKAVFEKNGFTVCPIPVDRQAIPNVPWYTLLPQTTALVKFDMLLHEWVGILIYHLRGQI